jgi:hypothetical protein
MRRVKDVHSLAFIALPCLAHSSCIVSTLSLSLGCSEMAKSLTRN